MSTKIPFYQVDAFTAVPFQGNPAATCLLQQALPEKMMQQIALENNLPETAFLLPAGDGSYHLRWFTPTTEIKLCGHGTLATAHILWEKGLLGGKETARFHTLSGLLTVQKKEDWLQLNFPAFALHEQELPAGMAAALGITPLASYCAEDGRWVVELDSEAALRSLKPDFTELKKFPSVVVTAKTGKDSSYDFVSRSFAPAHGIDEDPVTGSSHCALVPYWRSRLNKSSFSAFQASARGGELKLKLDGSRVLIEGKAVTVLEGFFTIPE
ncbi:MAG: PhzF family phenazine biosynthesis protein [Williamsia sp.]|nr:PhzF family phenazine biosynthesis protein [Williamsia sp.]